MPSSPSSSTDGSGPGPCGNPLCDCPEGECGCPRPCRCGQDDGKKAKKAKKAKKCKAKKKKPAPPICPLRPLVTLPLPCVPGAELVVQVGLDHDRRIHLRADVRMACSALTGGGAAPGGLPCLAC